MQPPRFKSFTVAVLLAGLSAGTAFAQGLGIKSVGAIGRGSGMQVTVVFTQPVEDASATDVANYSFPAGVTVSRATLINDLPAPDALGIADNTPPSGRNQNNQIVVLEVSGLTPGALTSLTVRNVKDRSDANIVIPETTRSFRVSEFKWTETGQLGKPTGRGRHAGHVVALADQQGDIGFDIYSNGGTQWANYDEVTFVYKELTGDFNFQARVEFQDFSSRWGRAGIQAREDLNENMANPATTTEVTEASRYASMHANPVRAFSEAGAGMLAGNNQFESHFRSEVGGQTTSTAGGTPAYPNAWVRIERTGDTLTTYRSEDGVNWEQQVQRDIFGWNQKLFVGPSFSPETQDGNIHPANGTEVKSRLFLAQIRFRTITTPFVRSFSTSPAGFTLVLEDGETAVNPQSVTATLDGATVSPNVSKSGSTTTIRYIASPPLPPGSTHTVVVAYRDNGTPPAALSVQRSFTVEQYATIPASYKLAANATEPGMVARVFQIDGTRGPGDVNSIANAEQQFAGGFIDPATGQPWANVSSEKGPVNISYVNWEQDGFDIDGTPEDGPDNFNSMRPPANPVPNDLIPGIPGEGINFNDMIVAEVLTYLRLQPGIYRMGVNSDDGFKVSTAPGAPDPFGLVLGSFNGGRGAGDSIFHFAVEEAGDYPFRLLWWEGTGGANVEWFTENLTTGERFLVNGPGGTGIPAFRNGADRAHVASILPADGYTGAARNVQVKIVLEDGRTQVVNGSITLAIDGQTVTPNVSKSGSTTTVTWSPPAPYDFSSQHTGVLTYQENTTPPTTWTRSFSFSVTPPTIAELGDIFVIEAEDFDYDGGQSNPQRGVPGKDVNVMPYLGGAYDGLGAIEGIDYNNNDGNDSDLYRTELDPNGENEINITPNTGGPGNGLGGTIPVAGTDRGAWTMEVNYRIGWVAAGEWQNYTRTIPAGWYKAWAALSYDGTSPGQLSGSLDRVTAGVGTASQTTERLGQFSAPGSGGWGANNLVPMKTATGADAVFQLPGGPVTLRFNLGSGDFDFLVLQHAAPPPPSVTAVPEDDVKRNEVVLDWTLADGASQVVVNTVRLAIDGVDVSSKVVATKTTTGATVRFDDTGTLYAAGDHTWQLSFRDNSTPPQTVTASGTFVVNPYPTEGIFVIEAEDFNYSNDNVTGGKTNPMKGVADMDVDVMPYLGGAYDGLGAVKGVDYNNNDGNESDLYRTELDPNGENEVNITPSNGRFGNDRGVYQTTINYRIGWVGDGEWQNYTRTFPTGDFQVWAALSYDGRADGQLRGSLDLVTSNPAAPDQSVTRLGSFNAPGSGGWGRNELVQMKNSDGSVAVVSLGGVQTVRFNLGSGDFDYLVFVPVGAPPSALTIDSVALQGGNIVITWDETGATLQSADAVTGPWNNVAGATSPYSIPASGTQKYFRLVR
jgi:hypothetical protein